MEKGVHCGFGVSDPLRIILWRRYVLHFLEVLSFWIEEKSRTLRRRQAMLLTAGHFRRRWEQIKGRSLLGSIRLGAACVGLWDLMGDPKLLVRDSIKPSSLHSEWCQLATF